jgi:regulator of cell morphogenesis and NO signaling
MPTATQSIREIVTAQPSAANIFHRFDIDLCGQADLQLLEACKALQLSVEQVLEKLADAEVRRPGAVPLDPATLSVTRLIQHIVRVHHQCVRQELPRLAEMAHKVAMKQGNRVPELHTVADLAGKLHHELHAHIEKEEQVLFPFISQMDQETPVAYPAARISFHSVASPILMMKRDRESIDHSMAEIVRLTNRFEIPAWACTTHVALFSGFREFEADLKQHFHLEDDVLFPRAVQMETELQGGSE